MNNGYLCVQRLIGSIPLARLSVAPLEKPAARYTQYVAQSCDRLPASLCCDPGVLHRDSLAKYAAAFFNISLSTFAAASSRRNRSTSASSSFADRGVADTPVDDPSLPARSSLTQLNKLDSGIPSLRLASE